MKDFVTGALVIVAVFALVMGIRFAAFFPLHSEAMAVKDSAPIAAADGDCAVTAVKMHCLRDANPESHAMASVPSQSGSAGAADSGTIAAQNIRCAARQVKIPCFQHGNRRS